MLWCLHSVSYGTISNHLPASSQGIRGRHRCQSGRYCHGGAPGGREVQRGVVDAGVVAVALGQEEVLLSRVEQGLPGEGLSVGQALGQGLAPRLRQQQQADDAQQRAAGEDHVVQEVALLVVQLHDGGREHAEAGTGQDQAQASTPAQRGGGGD